MVLFLRFRSKGGKDEICDKSKDVDDDYYLENSGEKMIKHDEIPLSI